MGERERAIATGEVIVTITISSLWHSVYFKELLPIGSLSVQY